MACGTQTIYTTPIADTATLVCMALPVVTQPTHRSGALLDHLARRMRLRTEAVLAPLGLRPRHLVALTVLRHLGLDSSGVVTLK